MLGGHSGLAVKTRPMSREEWGVSPSVCCSLRAGMELSDGRLHQATSLSKEKANTFRFCREHLQQTVEFKLDKESSENMSI